MKRTRLTEVCEKLLRNLVTRIFPPILHRSSNQADKMGLREVRSLYKNLFGNLRVHER